MRPYSQTLDGYLKRAYEIMSQLAKYHTTPEADILIKHMSDTLIAIANNPNGDRYMEFSEYNTRYGYANSIVGIVGESIVALNLMGLSDGPIRIATTDIDQDINATDMWFIVGSTEQSVQVKSVIMVNELLTRPTQYLNMKTDWISLIDIDEYHHYLCTPQMLNLLIHKGVTNHEGLKEIGAYWDNLDLYGTPADRLVRNIKHKQGG
jgi:hypothetical protein